VLLLFFIAALFVRFRGDGNGISLLFACFLVVPQASALCAFNVAVIGAFCAALNRAAVPRRLQLMSLSLGVKLRYFRHLHALVFAFGVGILTSAIVQFLFIDWQLQWLQSFLDELVQLLFLLAFIALSLLYRVPFDGQRPYLFDTLEVDDVQSAAAYAASLVDGLVREIDFLLL
jgi:hypothetical protein